MDEVVTFLMNDANLAGSVKPGYRGGFEGVPAKEFDPHRTATTFHQILSSGIAGLRSKECATVIHLVTCHNNQQRQLICSAYKDHFHEKDLAKELRKKLNGDLARLIFALMLQPKEFLARQIHRSIRGLGTDERKLVSLLCCRTNAELVEMKLIYREKYGKEMDEDVGADVSGEFQTLIISLMGANRSEWDKHDPELVHADAQALYEVRSADLGAREEIFNIIFTSRSPPHMQRVFQAYDRLSKGKLSIENTVNLEFSGSLRKAYRTMIKSYRDLVGYNAERLYKAIQGPGTDEDTLIRVLVTRSEIDLCEIAEVYQKRYGESLKDAVISDTSGDFQVALLRVLDNAQQC